MCLVICKDRGSLIPLFMLFLSPSHSFCTSLSLSPQWKEGKITFLKLQGIGVIYIKLFLHCDYFIVVHL